MYQGINIRNRQNVYHNIDIIIRLLSLMLDTPSHRIANNRVLKFKFSAAK